MSNTTIQQLAEIGQSIWLDSINRSMLDSGKLKGLIDQGLRGMTSNPSIFNQAIGQSHDYDEKIIKLKTDGRTTFQIYDALTITDIQDAADAFKPIYEQTDRLDGYVSLEINPQLADKVGEQIDEGMRLFRKVDRPNVMIKVPSTEQGFPVVEELIGHGINVNVTLIFSLEQYINTVRAYFAGLNRLVDNQKDLSSVHSVASVFISRIDTSVDERLEEQLANASSDKEKNRIESLKGQAAVANARIIFEQFKEMFNSEDFRSLSAKGANVQRCLWGSTSTKNPSYSDTKYVTELIAEPTVNTVPEKTLMAFLDHGKAKNAFSDDVTPSEEVIGNLHELGINVNHICQELLRDGVEAFDDAFEALLESIEQKASQLVSKS